MVRFRRSHLFFTCIIAWSSEIFRSTDGSGITWLEPPPSETIIDDLNVTEAYKSLVKGSLNAELSCNFSLSADLSIITVSMQFGSTPVANFAQSQQALSVRQAFKSRFNVTWVPNKLKLIFFQVTSADEGEFQCVVLTLGSPGANIQTWKRNIQVSLLVPPSITEITGNTVSEGENVTLHCSAKGTPDPNTTWTRPSDDRVVTMPLINISRHDVRDYRCTADNGVGSPATKDVFIHVQYPPEVNGSGHNVTVARGAEYTFSCPVDGNPDPNITWYSETGAYTGKQFKTGQNGCYTCVARNVRGISDNITQCLIINSSSPTVAPTTVDASRIVVSSAKTSQSPSSSSTTAPKAGPSWIIIIAVAGGVVLLAIVVGVLTWWVHKQRKCRKDPKIHNSDLGRHDDEGGYSQVQGAYAQSGPPAASGADGAIGQAVEVAAATPTYAVVDKSKKKKNKKLREEVPPVYAEVDKSKKKKKKVDDKNLYETLDEPKKARNPGELLYADLGDFQNPVMSPVSISPQPLPVIKIPEPYERTDYADITQFHKGNAKLPQNDGNEDTEMKPKRPSKKKIQGNDNETPI